MKSGIYELIVVERDDNLLKRTGIPNTFIKYKIPESDLIEFKKLLPKLELKVYSQYQFTMTEAKELNLIV